MPWSSPGISRRKALLGTDVVIRTHGLAAKSAQSAISAAFDEIKLIHSLMSFHEPASDVSCLNRNAFLAAQRVDARTFSVIARASEMADVTDGIFDVTVAPKLVEAGVLPAPLNAPSPDETGRWRDIELLPDYFIRFRKPLWIDLGGIAKGFAVDRAIAILTAAGATQACVNAGGDLRIAGPMAEPVQLRGDFSQSTNVPVVELTDCSLASSAAASAPHLADPPMALHIDAQTGLPLRNPRFVSVIAPECTVADALTKIVMQLGSAAGPLLRRFHAEGLYCDDGLHWTQLS